MVDELIQKQFGEDFHAWLNRYDPGWQGGYELGYVAVVNLLGHCWQSAKQAGRQEFLREAAALTTSHTAAGQG